MDRRLALRKTRSGEIARRRLKALLAADKTGCSPELLEMLKKDICHVVARYLDADFKEMEVGIRKTSSPAIEDTIPALYAQIPIRSFTYKGIF